MHPANQSLQRKTQSHLLMLWQKCDASSEKSPCISGPGLHKGVVCTECRHQSDTALKKEIQGNNNEHKGGRHLRRHTVNQSKNAAQMSVATASKLPKLFSRSHPKEISEETKIHIILVNFHLLFQFLRVPYPTPSQAHQCLF